MTSNTEIIPVRRSSYGVENDPVFRSLCIELAGSRLMEVFSRDGTPVCFLRGAFELAGRRFGHLVPLCGLFSAPAPAGLLASYENWSAIAGGLSADKGWINARLPALETDAAAVGQKALLRKGLASRKNSYCIRVISGKTFDQYLAERGGEFRRRHRMLRSAMAEKGLEYGAPAEIEEWKDLYRHRHPTLRGEDYSVTDEYQAFFKRCLDSYRKEGRCIEVAVRKGQSLLAAGFAMIFENVAYFYQTAHDPGAEEYRPGVLVFYRLIEIALNSGCALLSFMGDAPYLHMYTKEVLPRVELEAFSRTPAGIGLFTYRSLRRSRGMH